MKRKIYEHMRIHKLDKDALLQLSSGIRICYAEGCMESYRILSGCSSAVALYAELDLKFIPTTRVIDDVGFIISLLMMAISGIASL